MNDKNGLGPVVDLGEMHRRQKEKEQVPRYSVGSPEFALPVAVERLSFRDALDRAALMLDQDGFTVEEIKQCAFAGIDQTAQQCSKSWCVFPRLKRLSDRHLERPSRSMHRT